MFTELPSKDSFSAFWLTSSVELPRKGRRIVTEQKLSTEDLHSQGMGTNYSKTQEGKVLGL